MPLITLIFLVFLMFTITGCDSAKTVKTVCLETPEVCEDLNADGWCRAERRLVILGRHEENINPTDDLRYQLLLDLEHYKKCVHKASLIEHIKLKEKTTSRVNGYITSIREIKRISEATKNTNHPQLLYWHWSRNADEQALDKFLALQKNRMLETPELQLKLASYYTKLDPNLTIDILYHALSLYKGDRPPNIEILTTLSTIYLKQEKFKHAYVWGKLGQLAGGNDIDLAPLRAMLINENQGIAALDTLAEQYLEAIEAGEFKPPKR